MCDEGFQVDEPFRDKCDRLGICLHVSELETDIDLAEGSVQPRPLLEILAADADDENCAAETRSLSYALAKQHRPDGGLTHVYRGMNTGLHPCTLKHELRLLP